MRSSIHWTAYLVAFGITVFIFAIGILLGAQLNQQSSQQLLEQSSKLGRQATELEVLSLLGRDAGNASEALCKLYASQARVLGEDTATYGRRLEALENARGAQDESVQSLKSEYMVLEIRDFLFVREVNRRCNDRINTILYFYSNRDCPACKSQGETLSRIRQGSPNDILVYSFDKDLPTNAVEALKESYGISKAPALVVNGKLMEGSQSEPQIKAALH